VRITYDREADALYIAFGEGPATVGQPQGYVRQPQGYVRQPQGCVQEVGEGIALDWDGEGRLLGIDMKSSRFLSLSRGSQSLGLSDRRLVRRELLLEGKLWKDFL